MPIAINPAMLIASKIATVICIAWPNAFTILLEVLEVLEALEVLELAYSTNSG